MLGGQNLFERRRCEALRTAVILQVNNVATAGNCASLSTVRGELVCSKLARSEA
jgi:hypothetical protein